jgi:hypothetical protein
VVTSFHLRGSVFTDPLPRSELHNSVFPLLRVGARVYFGRCLTMDFHVTVFLILGCNDALNDSYPRMMDEHWTEKTTNTLRRVVLHTEISTRNVLKQSRSADYSTAVFSPYSTVHEVGR